MGISLAPIGVVLVFIAIGFLCRKTNWITAPQVRGLSFFAMTIALPCLIIRSFARIDLADVFDLRIYVVYFSVAFAVFGLSWCVARFVLKVPPTKAGLLAMASCFSNLGLIGLPILESTWGEHGVILFAIIVSLHPALMFTLTIGTIAFTSRNDRVVAGHWYDPFIGLLRNPIIVAVLIGGSLSLSGMAWPPFLLQFFNAMGGAAGPCALFCVGAFLSQVSFRSSLKVVYASVFKVVLMPVLVFCMGRYVVALEAETLIILTFMAGLPTGANVSVLSQKYQTAEAEISSVISAATLIALASLPLMILFLGSS
jgi:predicted permease